MSLDFNRILLDIETQIETLNYKIRKSKIGCVTNDIRDNIVEELKNLRIHIQNLLKNRMISLENIEKKKQTAEKNVTQMIKFRKDRDERYEKQKENYYQFESLMKSQVNKINFNDLKKLKKGEEVEKLFKFLYTKLYNEEENTYKFEDFMNHISSKSKVLQSKIANCSGKNLSQLEFEKLTIINDLQFKEYSNNEGLSNLLIWANFYFMTYEAYKEFLEAENHFENVKLKQKDFINDKIYNDEVYNDTKKFIDFLELLMNKYVIPYEEEIKNLDNQMQNRRIKQFDFSEFQEILNWRNLIDYGK